MKQFSARYWWLYKYPLLVQFFNLRNKPRQDASYFFPQYRTQYLSHFLQNYQMRYFNFKMQFSRKKTIYGTNQDISFLSSYIGTKLWKLSDNYSPRYKKHKNKYKHRNNKQSLFFVVPKLYRRIIRKNKRRSLSNIYKRMIQLYNYKLKNTLNKYKALFNLYGTDQKLDRVLNTRTYRQSEYTLPLYLYNQLYTRIKTRHSIDDTYPANQLFIDYVWAGNLQQKIDAGESHLEFLELEKYHYLSSLYKAQWYAKLSKYRQNYLTEANFDDYIRTRDWHNFRADRSLNYRLIRKNWYKYIWNKKNVLKDKTVRKNLIEKLYFLKKKNIYLQNKKLYINQLNKIKFNWSWYPFQSVVKWKGYRKPLKWRYYPNKDVSIIDMWKRKTLKYRYIKLLKALKTKKNKLKLIELTSKKPLIKKKDKILNRYNQYNKVKLMRRNFRLKKLKWRLNARALMKTFDSLIYATKLNNRLWFKTSINTQSPHFLTNKSKSFFRPYYNNFNYQSKAFHPSGTRNALGYKYKLFNFVRFGKKQIEKAIPYFAKLVPKPRRVEKSIHSRFQYFVSKKSSLRNKKSLNVSKFHNVRKINQKKKLLIKKKKLSIKKKKIEKIVQ